MTTQLHVLTTHTAHGVKLRYRQRPPTAEMFSKWPVLIIHLYPRSDHTLHL